MASITWLHLSDWHQSGPDFDRKVVRDGLIKDLHGRGSIDARLANVDFGVFSGDLSQRGKDEEYKAAREHLLDPILKEIGLGPGSLLIVPGNHDIDRGRIKLVPATLSQPLTSSEAAQEWLTDHESRESALAPMRSFRKFVTGYTGHTSPDYANLQTIKVEGRSIALLGLNSAWMCGRNRDGKGEVDDRGHVVLGEPQIHDALAEMADADVRIVALHHPWDWLAEWDRERVEDRILESAHFVLTGHVHRPKVKINKGTSGDCVEIPAGASYDRRVAANPRYVNAYNWVHLDLESGQGTVFLRRWSEPRTAWIEDTDAATGGRYEFQLPKGLAKPRVATPVAASPEAKAEAKVRATIAAETRYRKLLLESCDIVNLANLPEQDRHMVHRRLELRRLYVPLRVRLEEASNAEEQGEFWDSLEIRRTAERNVREGKPKTDRQDKRVAVGERFAESGRLIVLGDPGAGKTTLTRWIATAYLLRLTQDPAWREMPDVATLPDLDLLPIIVRCRDLDLRCLGGPLEDILNHTLRKAELNPVEAEVLKELLRGRLQDASALLILDGLDEISEPGTRARFCEQLEQIAVAYPRRGSWRRPGWSDIARWATGSGEGSNTSRWWTSNRGRRAMLEDPDDSVRSIGLVGLGRTRSEAAVRHLIERVDNPKGLPLADVIAALGATGSAAAHTVVVRYLSDPNPALRAVAVAACGNLKSDSMVERIIPLLDDTDEAVRRVATEALGAQGGTVATEILQRRLSDASREMRTAALVALLRAQDIEVRILLTRDVDGVGPYLDPRDSITEKRVEKVAAKLKISSAEVRARYDAIADQYSLKLEWR